ncbi:hypothetical protein MPDQ_004572 [Monascus purpureus]|uniref:Zn(2)-C6 fungal-type domain-containing protein n=1 Tax=Monascus purpureus TaxID=5098 RepID=A0A507R341_MONPU|nr:hypothetical protein MPDQ_004572 [Monascus purpureus]BDD61606.1 hypothetical protein MAP00_006646 [Monascus purpureus]
MPGVVEYTEVTVKSPEAAMKGPNAPNTEKKRNKLGYHRTSVACVHCRRRKIRCEVAPDDPQGRCVDCIKLRKECKYYPVDQQPPAEKKSRPASRADTLPTAFPSTAASNTSGHRAEQPNTFFPHQAVSLSPGPGAPAFDAAKYVGNQVPFTTDRNVASVADYAAHAPLDPSIPWNEFAAVPDTQFLGSLTEEQQQMLNLQPNLWNQRGTPIAPIPPNPPTVPSQQDALNSAAVAAGGSRSPLPASTYTIQQSGPQVWQVPFQQPTRSMSFPTPAEMPSPYTPDQFAQQISPPDPRRSMTSPAHMFSDSPVSMNMNMGAQSPPPPHQSFPNSPLHMNPHSSPPPPEFHQPSPVSASYAGQPQPPLGYTTWQDMNNMADANLNIPYAMYTPDNGMGLGMGMGMGMGMDMSMGMNMGMDAGVAMGPQQTTDQFGHGHPQGRRPPT